jgi:hypothetical protein
MAFIGFDPKTRPNVKTDIESLELDRGFIAHFQIEAADAVVLSADGILSATALTDAEQSITESITDPGIPRNISIVGNAAEITGDIVVTGTNYANEEITETIALNGVTTVEGAKAFKTVTQIDLPVEVHTDTDTISVGFGNKIGLPYKLSHNTILYAFFDNTKEATAPTVTISSTDIESNTAKLNSALNGKIVDIYLVV